MEEPEKYYHSTLIATSHTVSWTLHDVSNINEVGAWTALACDLELPLGTHRISRWSITLYERDGTMWVRPKILSPQNEAVTFKLSIRVGGSSVRDFTISEIHSKVKDPVKFELGETQRILAEAKNDELELGVTLKLFSQDLWETK